MPKRERRIVPRRAVVSSILPVVQRMIAIDALLAGDGLIIDLAAEELGVVGRSVRRSLDLLRELAGPTVFDIERRIAQVYQECRTPEAIEEAFDLLQAELEEQATSRMAETRQALLDNFDEEVHTRLKFHRKAAFSSLSQREQWLLALTQHELGDQATFDPQKPRFFYFGPEARHGNYCLDWKQAEKNRDTFYRLDHPLAQKLIQRARDRQLPTTEVIFDYKAHGARIAALEKLIGCSAWSVRSRILTNRSKTSAVTVSRPQR